MPGKKIAHKPGYELKENPETGARRWHAILKKQINPETGEVFEVPALFEDLPEPTPVDVARSWARARGIARYPGGEYELPDPKDFAEGFVKGQDDFMRTVKALFDGDPLNADMTDNTLGNWLNNVAEAIDYDVATAIDEDNAAFLLALADRQGLDDLASTAIAALGEDGVWEWLKEFEGEDLEHPVSRMSDAIDRLDHLANGEASTVMIGVIERFNKAVNEHDVDGVMPNYSFDERAAIMAEQREEVLPQVRVFASEAHDGEYSEQTQTDSSALDLLRDDDVAFQGFIDEFLYGSGGASNLISDSSYSSDYDKIENEDDRRAVREKFVTFIEKTHAKPAIATNRYESSARDLLESGEYGWRRVGEADSRVAREESIGLGRVVYGAYAHEDAVPMGGSKLISPEFVRDPDTLNLGTDMWGRVRLLWVPKELKNGNTSYAFDDIAVDDNFDLHDYSFTNSAILGGLAHALRSVRAPIAGKKGFGMYNPVFTEIHLDRPLSVETDLAKVFVPSPLEPFDLPNDAKKYANHAIDRAPYLRSIANALPDDKKVTLVVPHLGSGMGVGGNDDLDFAVDMAGEIGDKLKSKYGGKVDLWLPRAIKERM